MNFLIVTHVLHKKKDDTYFGYAPYVVEMNLWFKHVDNVTVVAPLCNENTSKIDLAYNHKSLDFIKIPEIAFISCKKVLSSFLKLPIIFFRIFRACKKADHIHLRCPGNIGLLGCLVQVLFPSKTKTAKYAGNWDPQSRQPLSYKFQKWILSSPFLTKNMQVLVYGSWNGQTKNIKSFFTASFKREEIEKLNVRNYNEAFNFMFVGSLVKGKRPLLAIKIVEALMEKGKQVDLGIYGEGPLRAELQDYINYKGLNHIMHLKGNQNIKEIKESLKKAHFLLLPSKSEGWPKAVAEAMFFGVIPISTRVSCVPYMLDFGNRGILIEPDLNEAIEECFKQMQDKEKLAIMANLATEWSQRFTLDYFETEIRKLIVRQ